MKLFVADAFSERPFAGNPAAVCLLEQPHPADWMQQVAAEMNLSETAFLSPPSGDGADYHLRWFTPACEVDLCGHATLAGAHVLWQELGWAADSLRFETRSGLLTAVRQQDAIWLDFPATPASEDAGAPPAGLLPALGLSDDRHSPQGPILVEKSAFDHLVVVKSEQVVRDLAPDFRLLRTVDTRGVIVTAHSEAASFDFVSRFFAPRAGVDEDPVTGSAHCCLGPFWGARLGRQELTGLQASARGGVVRLRLRDDRVQLGGRAVTTLRGELVV
jgi:PhzF family phenazine biosynthesis protein